MPGQLAEKPGMRASAQWPTQTTSDDGDDGDAILGGKCWMDFLGISKLHWNWNCFRHYYYFHVMMVDVTMGHSFGRCSPTTEDARARYHHRLHFRRSRRRGWLMPWLVVSGVDFATLLCRAVEIEILWSSGNRQSLPSQRRLSVATCGNTTWVACQLSVGLWPCGLFACV